jgi:uncharacterized membrane protein
MLCRIALKGPTSEPLGWRHPIIFATVGATERMSRRGNRPIGTGGDINARTLPRGQMAPGRSGLGLGYLLYIVCIMLWVLAIFLAPLLAESPPLRPAAGLIYGVCSGVCHQNPDRSLHLWGQPMAVCARCTFIYLGVLLSSSAFPILRLTQPPRIRYLFAAAAPLVLDAGSQLLGLRESTNTIRAVTGLVFGLTLALYVAPEAEETFSQLAGRTRRLPAIRC